MTISLNNVQISSLLNLAQTALIPQKEFFDILEHIGVSGFLEMCFRNGVLASTKPAVSEMNFALMANMRHFVTSNFLFFTHSERKPPIVDIRNWKLNIVGDGVKNLLSISYDNLLKLPSVSYTRYLESAGNGRIFFDLLSGKKTRGYQWHFGGFGIAEWTGVRLAELLGMAGLKKSAVEIKMVGIDNSTLDIAMPLSKALEEDTILAYIMNGSILPVDHGFPLRAIVPGWIGAFNTKWVSKIIVSTQVSNNDEILTPVSHQIMKSACCLPWPAKLRAGHQRISGYAWSPYGRIAGVDISLDGGISFYPASLTGPNIERAGTRWEFCLDTEPGVLTITTRATDTAGNTQYDVSKQQWNERGYLFGAMVPHPVTVAVDSGEVYGEDIEDYSTPGAGCC